MNAQLDISAVTTASVPSIEEKVSPAEFSKRFNYHVNTVYRMLRQGKIPSYRNGSTGHYRIPVEKAKLALASCQVA